MGENMAYQSNKRKLYVSTQEIGNAWGMQRYYCGKDFGIVECGLLTTCPLAC